jgi:hypothetical protein
MKTITLVFKGVDEEELLQALARPDSGLRVDPRPPLRSGIELGIAVAGIVINAAQLAVTVYDLKKKAKEKQPDKGEVGVGLEKSAGEVVPIKGESAEEIKRELE